MADHGTHARYSKGCRCEKCRVAHRAYERNAARRRRRVKYGIEAEKIRLVDSEETRQHVLFLASRGIGLGALAKQVGTNRATIQYIKRGTRPRITVELSSKILAVPAIPREPMAYTSAEPILELLKQLEKKGISSRDVGRAMGCRYGNLQIKKKMRVWRYKEVEKVCKEMLRLNP